MTQLKARDEEVLEWIEHELQLNQTRLVTADEEEVDFSSFLRLADGEDISSDEEENESSKSISTSTIAAANTSIDVIVFSDDENEDAAETVTQAPTAATAAVIIASNTTIGTMPVTKQVPKRVVPVVSARAALKQNLKKKVIKAAGYNLCQQMKITSSKLQLRTEITEKCRFVIGGI